MIHHYIVAHNTETQEWVFEDELLSEVFKLETIYDPELNEWHRPYIGDDEFFPNEERLTEILGNALDELNKKEIK